MSNNKSSSGANFSKRIVIFFIILILIMLVIFGALSFVLTRINVSSTTLQTMNNTGSLISGLLNDHMKSAAEQVDIISSNPSLKDFIASLNKSKNAASAAEVTHGTEFLEKLDSICGSNGIVSAWIVSEQSGTLVANGDRIVTADEYSLDEKQWYKKYVSGAAHAKKYICTGVSPSIFNPSENVITIIHPVSSDGNTYAFCGVEINADSVFAVLSKYTFNTGSYPIVAADSDVIYSPSGSSFTSKFSLSESPLVNIISQTSLFYGNVDSYVSEKSGTVYYYVETGDITGWNVIVLFDSSEINGNIYSTFMQQLAVLVCLVALTSVFIISIIKHESEGLDEVYSCSEELVAGNLNYRIQKPQKTEVGKIASNINRLAELMQAKNAIISNYNTVDTLTGLNNRISLYEYMEDLIHTREEGRSRFAVMFIDIDNFKWLNETLGHNFGDSVLSAFARVLKEQLHSDCGIFRFSGDEFIVVKEFDTDYSAVYNVIEKLHQCFNTPLEVLNDKIYVKFSVGVSIFPEDDQTPDLLLRDAEMALHRAKESGKDRVAFYSNSHKNHPLYSKAAIARSLNEALQNGELYLHYQPIVSAKNCDIHGFEVLLRWISPEFGVVPPTEFISVAEESGTIVQIGTWIFESACRTLKQINENFNPDVIMSINVSPVQLRRDNYIEHIKRVIDITQVNPKNIQLEITESTLIDFTDSKSNVINEINDMGIALALDDFGTGYSSLNYLKNFPIKCLKIDKSFIDEINNNKRDYAITDSIIDLVHNLGIHTVAEGIETVGQYDFLTDMNCDYIQGFLMSKPLEENDVIEFVEKYNALHRPDKHKLEENERKLADEKKQRDKEKQENASDDSHEVLTEDFIISK